VEATKADGITQLNDWHRFLCRLGMLVDASSTLQLPMIVL